MSQPRLPPPSAEACLVLSRASTCKGGTIIVADVLDLAAHEARVCRPDGYRPAQCPRCECTMLHVHDYPERRLRDGGSYTVVRIVRYLCANEACAATWRVLPGFIARHLWRAWTVVETATMPRPPPPTTIPASTVRRWCARLCSSASQLVGLLVRSGSALLARVAEQAGVIADRRGLVGAFGAVAGHAVGARLGHLAAITHELERGVRVM